jgi:bacteriocin-like protein
MDREQFAQAKSAKSVKELSKMAHDAGIEISDSTAEKIFAEAHSSDRELSDTELSNVSGGNCSSDTETLDKKYRRVNADDVCVMFMLSYWLSSVSDSTHNCANCHYVVKNKHSSTLWCEKRTK